MSLVDRIGGFYSRLSPRERRLAIFWVFAMSGIAIFIVSTKVLGSISEVSDNVEQNVEMLDLISKKQRDYLARQQGGGNQQDVNARIDKNELKLTTYLDKEASRYDLKIDNFKESTGAVGGKRGKDIEPGTIIEESVTIDINRGDYKNVVRFLDAIARSRELILVKRVRVNRPKRAGETWVSATITVSTFKRQES